MILHTNDYLEYYLTLVGWLINGGIWNMIEDSGLFAAPFAAIVISEWLRARGEGADEGNKGVLSLARVENRFYTAILVIILACMPLVNVSIDTIQFDEAAQTNASTRYPIRPTQGGKHRSARSTAKALLCQSGGYLCTRCPRLRLQHQSQPFPVAWICNRSGWMLTRPGSTIRFSPKRSLTSQTIATLGHARSFS